MIHIGLVGFGEAGYHISKDFPKDKVALSAYDAIATQDTPRAVKVREHAAENGVTLVGSLRELAERATISSALPVPTRRCRWHRRWRGICTRGRSIWT